MCVGGVGMCVLCAKLLTLPKLLIVLTYFNEFSLDLKQKDIGIWTHMLPQFKGHLRSLTPNGQDTHNWSLYPHI